MRRHILDENGLTPAEERFVGLIARGYTQRQATMTAFPGSKLSVNAYDQKARDCGESRQWQQGCSPF